MRHRKVLEAFSFPIKIRARAFTTCTTAKAAPEDSKPLADWDLAGLKSEARRQADRAMKKVGKATTRLRKAHETAEALMNDEDSSLEDLEGCPDVKVIEAQVEELRSRAVALNDLNDALSKLRSTSDESFADLVATALSLGVKDAAPPKPPRGPRKQKGQPSKSRLPYITYTSADGIDIRVGRKSEDNDELSCNPNHRDSDDWWMHAAGCPGSHVVIRFTGPDVPRETLQDAAVLTVKNSKSQQAGKVRVSLVRCRQVSKPKGAKAGLVQLSGGVKSVTVNLNNERERLERLATTKRY